MQEVTNPSLKTKIFPNQKLNKYSHDLSHPFHAFSIKELKLFQNFQTISCHYHFEIKTPMCKGPERSFK